jgi:hypothetical protein
MLRLIAGLLRRPAGGLRPTAPSHDTVLGHLAGQSQGRRRASRGRRIDLICAPQVTSATGVTSRSGRRSVPGR